MSAPTKEKTAPAQAVETADLLAQILAATKETKDRMSVADLKIVAKEAADSRMFGMTEAQAFMLMQLAQAEGIHPAKALQRYHISKQGRPIMKAEAVLADFLKRGGSVEWLSETDDREACEAVFTHPRLCPNGKLVRFTMRDAKAAGVAGNDTWRAWSPAMLRARVSTIGVRMIDPGILAGMYTEEESEDFPIESREGDHLASANHNDTGHGSGAYAAPEEVSAYTEWIRAIVEEVNSKWLDRWTSKHGEIAAGVKELLSTYQLSGHLLKWARSAGMVNSPAESRAGSRDKYAAVAWSRFTEQFDSEARTYARLKWTEEVPKIVGGTPSPTKPNHASPPATARPHTPAEQIPADECEVDDQLEGVTDATAEAADSDVWPAGKE